MSPQLSNLIGILCAISSAIFFSVSLITARSSYDYGCNPQTVILTRFVLLAVLMFLWNSRFRKNIQLPQKDALFCTLLGVTYFVGIGSYLMSVSYLPVSLAVIIFYTFPILVALSSAVISRRWPGLLEISAFLIAFFGLTIALDVKLVGLQTTGLIFAMCASLGITLNMLGGGYLVQRMPATVLNYYQSITVCILASIVLIFSGGPAMPQTSYGWLVFSIMLISFTIAFISIYAALRLVGAVLTSNVMNLEPVATILFAVVLLGEFMTPSHILGGSIVLAGIMLAQWSQVKVKRAA